MNQAYRNEIGLVPAVILRGSSTLVVGAADQRGGQEKLLPSGDSADRGEVQQHTGVYHTGVTQMLGDVVSVFRPTASVLAGAC